MKVITCTCMGLRLNLGSERELGDLGGPRSRSWRGIEDIAPSVTCLLLPCCLKSSFTSQVRTPSYAGRPPSFHYPNPQPHTRYIMPAQRLRQPWKEYLEKKSSSTVGAGYIPSEPTSFPSSTPTASPTAPASAPATTTMAIDPPSVAQRFCPGSAQCGFDAHPLGSTLACAFESKLRADPIVQGSTGTSG